MTMNTRKVFSGPKLKRLLQSKLQSRSRLRTGNATVMFMFISYLIYLKKLGKQATLAALMDKKRVINKEHLYKAHEDILEETRVKRKQRTLHDMLPQRHKEKQ